MRYRFLIFSLVLYLIFPVLSPGAVPLARKGILDLRDLENKERFLVRLNGEWEFYWNKILKPDDFSVPGKQTPDLYGKVPSYWIHYKSAIPGITKTGFATYRLIMLLPHGFRNSLGFDVPVFDSSYEIFVNGRLMAANGTPGKTEKETNPWYEKNFFRYTPASDSLTILINVSNFHHRRGGFWLPLKAGTFREVQKRVAGSWALDWAAASFLFGFAIFFLFFFVLYPKDKLIGFFSLATIGLAFRPFFTSNYLIHNVFSISWQWVVRFEYLGLYVVLFGWYWFTLKLYPSKQFRLLTFVLTVICIFIFILTLFLPVKLFSYSIYIYYPSLLILIIYSFFRSIRGMLERNNYDFVYFAAFVLLTFAAIHDVGVSLGRASYTSGYFLTYALVIFVFLQATILLYRWVKSYYEKEKLQEELQFLNKNLEIKVSQRTQEINKRKEEIEKQNIMIASQNRQLSESLQLKNKIFSVIAHDLRSPIVNILYMLNLLKEDEYKEKYDTFANASISYAQQVITLLENMLVWGRGQQDKIKFAPDFRDLADIILTNLSIFKESADKKDISVNFTQIGNSKAYFDKDLMDIIIRNLFSNAVKYTPRGGRISILLKDKTQTKEGVVLKIFDNGIGIPESKQKQLFSASEIESTPGTENEKGTGLGLKLCYELVKINNGSISVESKEGEGTCFTITLPAKKP
jgi:signal transduction histidine kinase